MTKIEELDEMMHSPNTMYGEFHEDSIMRYGRVCGHDDRCLCEHRRKAILDFIKANFIERESIKKRLDL